MTHLVRRVFLAATTLLLVGVAAPAFAHVGHGPHVHLLGFTAGFAHPWLGLDHLLAMVLVGLLAVRARSKPALFLVPASFVGGMLVGAAVFYWAPSVGAFMPFVEAVIAASVIILGLAVVVLPRVSVGPVMALVALAGMFHGGAHVYEASGAVVTFVAGMALATALLHALGVGTGLLLSRVRGMALERVAGGAIAGSFVLLLLV